MSMKETILLVNLCGERFNMGDKSISGLNASYLQWSS